MARFEFEYTKIDGLLYPNIEVEGKSELDSLGKYGRLRLTYLHEQKAAMYRELLFTGKLAEHCTMMDKTAFEMAEHIRADYLKKHPMPDDNILESIRISTQAQMIADKIVADQLVCS